MNAKDILRNHYMKEIRTLLESMNEEILVTGSNEFAIPCVDNEGNDQFLVLTFKIPKGSRDGEAYDGYSVAEEYAMKQKKKAEKEKEKKSKAEKEKKKKGGKAE